MSEESSQKRLKAVAYRKMIGAMAKVRWSVEHNRVKRPDGAWEVNFLMNRFREYALLDPDVAFDTQLQAISDFVGLSVDELYYFSDIGEWIDTERECADIENEDDFEDFWTDEANIPSMDLLHRMRWLSRSESEREEISLLDSMYYGK